MSHQNYYDINRGRVGGSDGSRAPQHNSPFLPRPYNSNPPSVNRSLINETYSTPASIRDVQLQMNFHNSRQSLVNFEKRKADVLENLESGSHMVQKRTRTDNSQFITTSHQQSSHSTNSISSIPTQKRHSNSPQNNTVLYNHSVQIRNAPQQDLQNTSGNSHDIIQHGPQALDATFNPVLASLILKYFTPITDHDGSILNMSCNFCYMVVLNRPHDDMARHLIKCNKSHYFVKRRLEEMFFNDVFYWSELKHILLFRVIASGYPSNFYDSVPERTFLSVLQVPGLKLDRDQITHHYLPRIEVWHDQTVFTILDTWRSVSVVIDCWPSDSQKSLYSASFVSSNNHSYLWSVSEFHQGENPLKFINPLLTILERLEFEDFAVSGCCINAPVDIDTVKTFLNNRNIIATVTPSFSDFILYAIANMFKDQIMMDVVDQCLIFQIFISIEDNFLDTLINLVNRKMPKYSHIQFPQPYYIVMAVMLLNRKLKVITSELNQASQYETIFERLHPIVAILLECAEVTRLSMAAKLTLSDAFIALVMLILRVEKIISKSALPDEFGSVINTALLKSWIAWCSNDKVMTSVLFDIRYGVKLNSPVVRYCAKNAVMYTEALAAQKGNKVSETLYNQFQKEVDTFTQSNLYEPKESDAIRAWQLHHENYPQVMGLSKILFSPVASTNTFRRHVIPDTSSIPSDIKELSPDEITMFYKASRILSITSPTFIDKHGYHKLKDVIADYQMKDNALREKIEEDQLEFFTYLKEKFSHNGFESIEEPFSLDLDEHTSSENVQPHIKFDTERNEMLEKRARDIMECQNILTLNPHSGHPTETGISSQEKDDSLVIIFDDLGQASYSLYQVFDVKSLLRQRGISSERPAVLAEMFPSSQMNTQELLPLDEDLDASELNSSRGESLSFNE